MKANIILLAVGSFVGLLLGGIVGAVVLRGVDALHPESRFESLDDLRGKMVERDERDMDSGGSVSLRSLMIPHPDDTIIYTLAPKLDVTFQRVRVTTNSFGMRDDEIALEKPSNTYRIAMLGDSFAFGWGVEQDKIFARILETKLTELFAADQNSPSEKLPFAGKRVEVLNFGVPGYSTFQEAALFLERGLKFKPDAVLIYYVNNDFGLPFFIRDVQNDGKLANVVSYVKQVWEAEDPRVQEQRRAMQEVIDPNRAIKRLVEALKPLNVPLYLAINPGRKWKRERSRLWILKREPYARLLRITEPFNELVKERGLDPKNLKLPRDPHPNATKHGLLGEVLAETIHRRMVRDAKGLPDLEG